MEGDAFCCSCRCRSLEMHTFSPRKMRLRVDSNGTCIPVTRVLGKVFVDMYPKPSFLPESDERIALPSFIFD